MATMFFKAGRRNSKSYDAYRQILKSGPQAEIDAIDVCADSDDVIYILPVVSAGKNIIIDCDKKTGVFRLQVK